MSMPFVGKCTVRRYPPSYLSLHSMRPLDRTAMAKKYNGKWVALKADRKSVVSSGDSVRQVLDGAHKKGCQNPVVTRMPKSIKSFIGSHHRA